MSPKRVFRARWSIGLDGNDQICLTARQLRFGSTALAELAATTNPFELPKIDSDPAGYERQCVTFMQVGLMALHYNP